MSWAKLDDRFASNVKIRNAWRASRASIGLYVMSITYSAQHETNGVIDQGWVHDTLPTRREREAAVQALVSAGLWITNGDGYSIHDYLDYQPSRESMEAKRAADSERKARGRDTQARKRPRGIQADSARSPDGVQAESSGPVPTRPDPTKETTWDRSNVDRASAIRSPAGIGEVA